MVYVAGGVTNDTTGQRLVVDKVIFSDFFQIFFSQFSQVEKYDFANNAWVFEADLPWKLTGFPNQGVIDIMTFSLAWFQTDIC